MMMIQNCSKVPCGLTSGGCFDAYCPQKQAPWGGVPAYMGPPTPMGCICPPTSEKTCEAPMCPRQNPLKPRARAE